MSRILNSFIALAPGFIASVATAQDTPAPAPTAPVVEDIKPSVTPYGIIQAYTYLSDSESNNSMNSSPYITRMGLKANYGLVNGQIEVHFAANGCESKSSYAYRATVPAAGTTPAVTEGLNETRTCIDGNRVLVRRSDLNMNLQVSDTITLTPMIGRIRPGDVGGWGVDATIVTDGFSFIDGLGLGIKMALSPGNEVVLNGYYGNGMYNPAQTSTSLLHSSFAGRDDRAFVVSVRATIEENIKFAAYYGADKNAFSTAIGPGIINKEANEGNSDVQRNTVSAYDFDRWEAALGYDLGNISAGVFAWQYNYSATRPVTDNENGKLSFGADTGSSKSITHFGAGVMGDSTLFGLTDVLQKDGKITYGASAVRKMASADYSTQLAAGVGYTLGGFTVELDYAHTASKFQSLKKQDGTPTDSADVIYLTGWYVF